MSIRAVPKTGTQKLKLLLIVQGFPNHNLTQNLVVKGNCNLPTENQRYLV